MTKTKRCHGISSLARATARFDPKLVACAAVLGLSASALAGDVRGSVQSSETPKQASIAAVRAPYVSEWNGFIEPRKPTVDFAREVAVVLIGDVATRDAASVVMKDGTLTPSTVVMQAGTSLRLRNDDDFAHQLHAEGVKTFDAIETASGQGRQIQIDQTGSFPIVDKLAPHVRGTLHVLAKLTAVANPQADGTFVFREVAAGKYTLKVFRGASELSSTQLDVSDGHEAVIDPIAVDPRTR